MQTDSTAMLGSLADSGARPDRQPRRPCSACASPRSRPTTTTASATARPRRWPRSSRSILITVSAMVIGWRAIERLIDGARDRRRGARHRRLARRDGRSRSACSRYQRHVDRAHRLGRDRTDDSTTSPTCCSTASVIVALVLDQCRCRSTAPTRCSALLIALWLLWGACARRATRSTSSWTANGPRTSARAIPRRRAGISRARRAPRPAHAQAAGRMHFVQFHVWVPADWTVQEAHDRLDRVEEELAAALPGHRNPDPRRS